MRIKICGVTSASELALLDQRGVDFAGLWWQVPRGPRNLSTERLLELATTALTHTKPMLVTLGISLNAAIEVLLQTGIRALQLHGFELPGIITRLKAALPGLQVFKTLHVRADQCLERGIIPGYRDAGVDVFIADTFLSSEAVGSTGIAIPDTALGPLLAAADGTPVMLAGGVNARRIAGLKGWPGISGVDVDSAARVCGQIDADLVAELVRAVSGINTAGWGGAHSGNGGIAELS
jgi:phosphoribosylanthranilate isomerase